MRKTDKQQAAINYFQKRSLADIVFMKGKETIPRSSYYCLTFIMWLADLLFSHAARNFSTLGLRPGQTVIDYGCGPGRYIQMASFAVGKKGKVVAVDIHPLAMEQVKRTVKRHALHNVQTVLADHYRTQLSNGIADVIYALEMFHMIERPHELLKEFSRLIKDHGTIIIEDGHQARTETVRKIEDSGVLYIESHTKAHVKCRKL